MKFTTAFLAVAVATLAGAAPTSTQVPADQIHAVMKHLDSQGAIQWTPEGDDGQTATVTEQQLQDGYGSLQAREPAPPTSGWRQAGKIAGFAAEVVCLNSDTDTVKDIKSKAATACAALVNKNPEMLAAEKVWQLYQSGGSQLFFAQVYADKGVKPKSLTQTICEGAIDAATNKYCDSKKDTSGAVFHLSGDKTGWYVGFDKN